MKVNTSADDTEEGKALKSKKQKGWQTLVLEHELCAEAVFA
jgi:hypothetical protein